MTSATGWSAMDRQAWGGLIRPPYKPRSGSIVVLCDGSYSNGMAGIGYAAPFGDGSMWLEASSSGEAEDAALLFAMHAVYRNAASRGASIPKADFLTDCNPPLKRRPNQIRRYLASYGQWKIVPVRRDYVRPAHRLAIRALRGAA